MDISFGGMTENLHLSFHRTHKIAGDMPSHARFTSGEKP
jgi:hypothetical protein